MSGTGRKRRRRLPGQRRGIRGAMRDRGPAMAVSAMAACLSPWYGRKGHARGLAAPSGGAGPRSDRVAEHADPVDLELDDVARLEPASVPMFEDAARPDRAGADHVARPED